MNEQGEMGNQTVHWPANGRPATYRRAMIVRMCAGIVIAAVVLAALWLTNPHAMNMAAMLTASSLLIWTMGSHAGSRRRAQRAEIVASFASMHIIHQNTQLRVGAAPLIGSYRHRRDAVRASVRRGCWTVIVRAYGRWYVLAADQVAAHNRRPGPLSFRSRAVADVVPSIADTAVSA